MIRHPTRPVVIVIAIALTIVGWVGYVAVGSPVVLVFGVPLGVLVAIGVPALAALYATTRYGRRGETDIATLSLVSFLILGCVLAFVVSTQSLPDVYEQPVEQKQEIAVAENGTGDGLAAVLTELQALIALLGAVAMILTSVYSLVALGVDIDIKLWKLRISAERLSTDDNGRDRQLSWLFMLMTIGLFVFVSTTLVHVS